MEIYCSKCGKKISGRGRFCAFCGAEQPLKMSHDNIPVLQSDGRPQAQNTGPLHGAYHQPVKQNSMIAMTQDEMMKRAGATEGGLVNPEDVMKLPSYRNITEGYISCYYIFYSFEMTPYQLFTSFKYFFPDIVVNDANGLKAFLFGHQVYNVFMTSEWGENEGKPVVLHLAQGDVDMTNAYIQAGIQMGSLGRYQGSPETWPFNYAKIEHVIDEKRDPVDSIVGKWIPEDLADHFHTLLAVSAREWLYR